MEYLITAAQAACDAAVAAGAEFADASAHRGTSLSVSLEDCAIKSSDASDGRGVSVRAFYRGGVGWYSCGGIGIEAAEDAGEAAAGLAREADPDPDFVSLPEPAEYEHVEGLFDDAVAGLSIGQLIEHSLANIDAALSVEPDAIVAGGSGAGATEQALANSLGVVTAGRSSSVSCYTRVAIRRGDEVGMFYDFDYGRRLADFDPQGLGARAAQEAAKFLGARDIETKDLPVVFGPLASRGVLLPIAYSADAESVQRNRSFMVGKLGERVASEIVTLVDDPLIPGGMASRGHDGEGTARKPLTIVENGVLQTYLYDSYTLNSVDAISSDCREEPGSVMPTVRVRKMRIAGGA